MEQHQESLTVVMFPWLAHGHISPYLELAKKLSQRHFYIYFCSTPVNFASIKNQLSHNDFPSIQLVEFNLPSLPNLPPHYHTTKSLPPHLMPTLKQAFDMSTTSFSNLLQALEPKPKLLIYDFIQPWAPTIASSLNIPAIHFTTCGAASTCYMYHFCTETEAEYGFPKISLREHELRKLVRMFIHDDANELTNMDRLLQSVGQSRDVVLVKSFRDIEAKYIDYLSSLIGKEFLPVGPLVVEAPSGSDNNKQDGSNFMEWLDKKEQGSVVFVSFGTEFFMSKEEIQEIAYGLELSMVDFIWVIRFHEGEKIKVDEVLPQGFFDRVGDRGMVVEGWAPQAKILEHSSAGGFVSHCGWSSVMESMKLGVPIVAMPMQLDQPLNARLVEELGVGIEVKSDEGGRFERDEIAKVIKEVVVGIEGEKVRKKAKEVSVKMKTDGDHKEIDVVVKRLLQICESYDYKDRH